MVQTDISQITAECSEWRQVLRNYRDEFQQSKKDLETHCSSHLSREQFLEVEHFHNQFHIQLINIHDLKQAIKNHERLLQLELAANNTPSEETVSRHEALYEQFSGMEMTLLDLRTEFQNFCSQVS
jgi:hypothetical protein